MGCGCRKAFCTKPRDDNPFDNPKVKRKFIWRVLLILDGTLLVSLLPLVIFWTYPPSHGYIIGISWLFFIPAFIAFIVVQAILCFAMKIMKKRPVKIIFFIIWIVVHSILLSAVAIFFEPWVILVPCGNLTFVILLMVIYSRFAPCQIGHKVPVAYLFAAGVVLIVNGIVLGCLLEYWIYIIANFVLVLFLILVVLFDIELIVRDKMRHKFGKHEYIVATMILYRDVIWIIIVVLIIVILSLNCGSRRVRGSDSISISASGESLDSASSRDPHSSHSISAKSFDSASSSSGGGSS